MKKLALTSTIFTLAATGAMAQQSEIEFLRARADAHERKISQLESELNRLKSYYTEKQHPKAVPVPAASAVKESEYIVQKGDMLGRIAKHYKVSVASLKQANGLSGDNIRIGQKLIIPNAGKNTITTASLPPVPREEKPVPTSSYTVKGGDTFYSIARQHGVSIESLMLANASVNPKSIQVGQKLSIDADARPTSRTHSSGVAKKQKSLPKAKKTKSTNTAESIPARKSETEIRTITVHKQVTYGQFASKYGASTSQLNELNGLSLSKNTMLAIGSELYVPKD